MGSVWARLGVTIKLPKRNSEYKDEDALVEAARDALKRGDFVINGDSYIPESCAKDDFGFESAGDIELGDL
jgi:hypothetical protein